MKKQPADPDAKLFYNDYGLEEGGAKFDAVHCRVARYFRAVRDRNCPAWEGSKRILALRSCGLSCSWKRVSESIFARGLRVFFLAVLGDCCKLTVMHRNGDRLTLGRMQNPIRGFLHGAAALAAVVGSVVLWERSSGDPPRQVALLVFALSLVTLYTASSLYHSFPWDRVWKGRMQRVDHAMIYLLIAGTYTPIACIVLDGWLRYAALIVAWGIGLGGILQKIFFPSVPDGFSIAMQAVHGWLALPLFVPLAQRLPGPAMLLAVAGGLFYTIGLVFLVTERPQLWPRIFSYHELFHVFVVAGSAAHYAMTVLYLVPSVAA